MTNLKEQWDAGVGSYTELPDVSNVEIIFPAIMEQLGNVKGKRILDYGCGDGRLSRKMAESGAGVVGVDTSPSMIKVAQKKTKQKDVSYLHMQENNLQFLSNGSFDVVVANLVFMMIQSKEEIEQSMKEMHRVLKKDGRIIYSLTHPCFVDRGAHDYKNIFPDGKFNYMKEEYPYKFVLQDAQGKEVDENFYDYHHRLSTYLNETIQSGFTIQHVEELSYPDAVVKRHDISSKYSIFPQSLIVVAKKA